MNESLKAADAVWIATAILQRDAPESDFSVLKIVDRAMSERLTEKPRTTIYLHVNQHCVANRPPNTARLRMLVETPSGNRRLFHQGDEYHPLRENARILPEPKDLPSKYRSLLTWYQEWSAAHTKSWEETDPLMRLVGSGKHLWKDESGDEFLARLRSNWGGVA